MLLEIKSLDLIKGLVDLVNIVPGDNIEEKKNKSLKLAVNKLIIN